MATAKKTQDYLGTGRRKTSVARVRLRSGSGSIKINNRGVEDFFPHVRDRNSVLAPLKETDVADKVDVVIKVHGGGTTGQSEAILLGIARALKQYDPELEQALRDKHMLTRDARAKERKKYGLHGARRGTQFSKR